MTDTPAGVRLIYPGRDCSPMAEGNPGDDPGPVPAWMRWRPLAGALSPEAATLARALLAQAVRTCGPDWRTPPEAPGESARSLREGRDVVTVYCEAATPEAFRAVQEVAAARVVIAGEGWAEAWPVFLLPRFGYIPGGPVYGWLSVTPLPDRGIGRLAPPRPGDAHDAVKVPLSNRT